MSRREKPNLTTKLEIVSPVVEHGFLLLRNIESKSHFSSTYLYIIYIYIYLPNVIVQEHFNYEKAICFFETSETTLLDHSLHPCRLISFVNPAQNEITSRGKVALALLKISTFTVLGISEVKGRY